MHGYYQSRFLPSISHLLDPNGDCPPNTYRQSLKQLHTTAVSNSIASLEDNKVLQAPPPPVSELEKTLPRPTRTLLSQLRSGYSSTLKSYCARIGAVQDPSCPDCRASPHTTSHLFSCPATPTNLTPLDLWQDPPAAAAFLATVPSVAGAFAPRPPPEPPPPAPP